MANVMVETTQSDVMSLMEDATTSSTYNNDSLPPFGMEDFGTPGSASLFVILPLLILLMLTTIGGNIIVMICVRIDKRLASAISSVYVFSLAGADTIVGLFVMGGMCVYTVFGYWPLGPLPCTIWVVFDFACCTVSMLHLCLIAYDRYEAVVHPLDYRQNRSTKEAALRSLGAWALGIILWLPAIVVFRVLAPGPTNDCYFIPDQLYILLQSLIVYYGPIVVMVIFYIQCLNVLRQRYLKTVATAGDGPKLFMPPETTTTTTDGESKGESEGQGQDGAAQGQTVDVNAAVAQQQLRKQQQQLRSIRTLGVVMAMFLFCWLPFCLFWPITAYCPDCISPQAYEYSYWAAYLNSAINPFLYFMSNRDFRNAFMTMIGRGQDN